MLQHTSFFHIKCTYIVGLSDLFFSSNFDQELLSFNILTFDQIFTYVLCEEYIISYCIE